MNYEFPLIENINDVLPHIEGVDEFCVMDKGYAHIIQYNVITPTTFPDVTDIASAIRRECRGIAFYPDGKIMSRPFHKFFNLNEKPETQEHLLDFSAVRFLDKLDGSMIRPIWFKDGTYRLGTKRGITDTSKLAEEFMASSPLYKSYHNLITILGDGFTPLFEFCSNKMRIILPYPQEKMVLLAIRNNETGEYVSRHVLEHMLSPNSASDAAGVPLVGACYFDEPTPDVMDKIRAANDAEGYVVSFGQHMIKVKSDWYVDLHKVKEQISREKYVIRMILDQKVDDVLSRLNDDDLNKLLTFEVAFHDGWTKAAQYASGLFFDIHRQSFADGQIFESSEQEYAKRFAMALNQADGDYEKFKQVIFKIRSTIATLYNGNTDFAYLVARTVIKDLMERSLGSQKSIDKNRFLWNNVTYNYGEDDES